MSRTLHPLRGHVVVAVQDLEEHEEVTADGVHVRYVIDPSTGLAMAPDAIHLPVGVVVARGLIVEGLKLGTRILVVRDLGRCFAWEGMTCQALRTVAPCWRCDLYVPLDVVPAMILVENGERSYRPVGARVLVAPMPLPRASELEVPRDERVRWGVVVATNGQPDVHVGQWVAWRGHEPGAYQWTDAGRTLVSLRTGRACGRCGACVHEGQVLMRMEAEDGLYEPGRPSPRA